MKPVSILIPVPDVEIGLEWYKKAFESSQPKLVAEFDFTMLELDGFSLEIVQADSKVSNGKMGTVLYWSVPSIEAALSRFLQLGSKLYRGPMDIENDLVMCQIEDPFGNLIGLRGSK